MWFFGLEKLTKTLSQHCCTALLILFPPIQTAAYPGCPMDGTLPQTEWIKESSAFTFWMGENYGWTSNSQSSPLNFCRTVYIIWSHCKNVQMYGLFTTSPKWTQDTLSTYPWSPGSLILHSIQHLDLISLPCGPGVSEDKENCIHC